MARGVLEIPTVNTAALVTLNADGTCSNARACVGAISWKPIVLDLKNLAGQRLNEDLLRKSVQNVRGLAEPISDVRGSAAYKREMAVEFSARALIAAWQRAQRRRE
jgi:carbon-monoxide dehydrogenase medium subunit